MDAIHEKKSILEKYLAEQESAAIAYSSGVDSTFLLKVAKDTLGDKVIAITASSALIPERDLQEAKTFCESEGIVHVILHHDELSVDGFRQNPPDRCYICKKDLFTKMKQKASEYGIANLMEGSNVDDEGDYRPGMRAISELGILSPLKKAGLTKADIRALSEEMGLPTWNKPSFACLASRFVYGEEITKERLYMVDKGEELLKDLGFTQFRVRVHGNIARIELLPEDIRKITEDGIRDKVSSTLKDLGFDYVTLDLMGYRTGSMNETLDKDKR